MHTLKEIYQDNEERNFIDPSLYSRYRVKAGLRNDNGTGVKVGLTKICDVIGYKIIHEKKYNIDGQLIYRGYPINYLVNKQPSDKICGFEETAYLLIFGTLPNADQLKTFKDKNRIFDEEYQECHKQLKMIKDLFDLNDYDEFKNEVQYLIYRKEDFHPVILQNNESVKFYRLI